MIHSDWHIHTDASYDARLPLETLIASAKAQGLRGFGVTDHLNYPNESFWNDIVTSAENYKRLLPTCPQMILGVELTPISQSLYDFMAAGGEKADHKPVLRSTPGQIAMTGDKQALMELGVRYAVGAAHWRVDDLDDESIGAQINDWHAQQIWLACDDRVTILGHPWACNYSWTEDFSIVPASMHDELCAAMLEHGKLVECNVGMFREARHTELFRRQYAEFLRSFFERGVPITYGSDCHGNPNGQYPDVRADAWHYLEQAGFRDGDFTDLSEANLW